MKYRKKPIVIEAIKWDGENYTAVTDFTSMRFRHTNETESGYGVWNTLERCLINVPMGHWIIRGVSGEFYPCDPEVFESTYESVIDD